MSSDSHEGYAGKQPPDYKPDPELVQAIKSHLKNGLLPCAVAFKIAGEAQVLPIEVGRAADAQEISLAKCQLGLFGYQPEKKIVKPETDAPPELVDALRAALVNNRLPCVALWKIADEFNLPKMKVCAVCEGYKIKVKPCQLGAF